MESNQEGKRNRRSSSNHPELPRLVVAMDHDSSEMDRRTGRRPVRERVIDWLLALIIASVIFLGWNAYDFGERLNTLSTNLATLTERYIR